MPLLYSRPHGDKDPLRNITLVLSELLARQPPAIVPYASLDFIYGMSSDILILNLPKSNEAGHNCGIAVKRAQQTSVLRTSAVAFEDLTSQALSLYSRLRTNRRENIISAMSRFRAWLHHASLELLANEFPVSSTLAPRALFPFFHGHGSTHSETSAHIKAEITRNFFHRFNLLRLTPELTGCGGTML